MTLSDTDTAQLWETFRAGGGAELVRGAVRLVLQELIEAEATEAIGAGRYERKLTQKQPKSLMRMLSPNGNPHARNLFEVIGCIQRYEGFQLEVKAVR